MRRAFCEGCLAKQRQLDALREENQRLRAQLRYREHQATAGAFGSATPSAQRPVKANSPAAQRAQRGGARPGHPGHGRPALTAASAARVVAVPGAAVCQIGRAHV